MGLGGGLLSRVTGGQTCRLAMGGGSRGVQEWGGGGEMG